MAVNTTVNMTEYVNASVPSTTSSPLGVANVSEMTALFVTNGTNDDNGTGVIWLANYWSSFVERPTSQQSTSAGVWIRLVGLPPVMLLGIVGNILAILVMSRPAMRRHSFSSYLLLLGVCDTISLLVRLLFWVNLFLEFQGSPVLITFTNLPACIISEYFITVNTVVCSWAVVCITYERVIIVIFPLTGTKLCKPFISRRVVVLLILFPLLLMSYIPFNTKYLPNLGCVMRYIPDMMIHYVMATTFVTMLPLALILFGNAVIIIQLKRQNKAITGTGNREDKVSRVTTMLVTVSLTFFILVLPNALMALLLALRSDWGFLRVAVDPAAFLWDLNFAINFYLYVITGDNVRTEAREMFSCIKAMSNTGTTPALQRDGTVARK
ncbi:FMRFamide receptor-like [Haliotis rufescens]|uniref:FMRFamide receptor-like n=1 Tax=Haliotis rufescens TaxID=6454 RepID=UPI00201F1E69|nr:FMRFamide receptor-like [Haliotis rufescens]